MPSLDEMSNAQLINHIKQELEQEAPDRAVVMDALEILQKREPVRTIPVEAFEAWTKVQRESKRPKYWKTWVSVGGVAAALALILFAVPPVFGSENIFQLIGSWTDSAFSFGADLDQSESEFKTDHEGLQQVYDAVRNMGITEDVVPTWLPPEYYLDELVLENKPDGRMVLASFTNGQHYIAYSISLSMEGNTEYQKDDKNVSVFESSGISHYILSNEGQWYAIWVNGISSCSIAAENENQLYKIISSIYNTEE